MSESGAGAVLTQAGQLFDEIDDDTLAQRIDAAVYLGWAEGIFERFGDAERHFERGLAVTRATGQGQFLQPLMQGQSYPLMWQGRIAEAGELMAAAVEGSRLGASAYILAWALFGRSWVGTYAGELTSALADAEEAMGLLRGLEPTVVTAGTGLFLAFALLEAGEAGRARRELLDVMGGPELPLLGRAGRCMAYEILTRAEIALGDVEAAEGWAARAEDASNRGQLPLETSIARRARAVALLAGKEVEAAAKVALAAAEQADTAGAPVEGARARILAGQALAKIGQRQRAMAELQAAETVLSERGAHGFATQAASALRRLGQRRPSRDEKARGTASLSERERQIAELVAAGHTNRQIATSCYLSPKTVERHLSHIFAKLGVTSRSAVGRALAAEHDHKPT